MAIAWAIDAWFKAPVGLTSSTLACGFTSAGLAPSAPSQRLQRRDRILAACGHAMDLAALGLQQAGLVRIGEKRHGIVGFDQHDVPKTLQRRLRLFDHVRHPIDRKPPAAARHPRTGQRAHHPAAGLAGDLRRQRQSLLRHRAAGHQQQGVCAAAQHLGRVLDGLRGVALTLRLPPAPRPRRRLRSTRCRPAGSGLRSAAAHRWPRQWRQRRHGRPISRPARSEPTTTSAAPGLRCRRSAARCIRCGRWRAGRRC